MSDKGDGWVLLALESRAGISQKKKKKTKKNPALIFKFYSRQSFAIERGWMGYLYTRAQSQIQLLSRSCSLLLFKEYENRLRILC